MNFALLGCDATVLPLVRAIAADARHRLLTAVLAEKGVRTLCRDPGDLIAEHTPATKSPDPFFALLAAAPGVRLETEWEGLPHDSGIDAVIAVAGGANEECMRQAAAAGKPVLFVPNGDPSSALVYELTLVRDDTQVPLVPVFPLRFFGPLQAAAEALRDGSLGTPLNLQWTREIAPAGKSAGLLDARDVHRALIHDADMLRQLGGNYSQVTAVRSGDAQTGFSMVTVTLAGGGLPTAVWTLRPAVQGPSLTLAIPTAAGDVTIRGVFGDDAILIPKGIEVSGSHPVVSTLQAAVACDPAKAVLDRFERAIADKGPIGDWPDLLRATEIVEAAERSVRRRRTIDLHFETASERSQFKTQMTAVGCGLMSMTLASVVFLLMAGALFDMHPLVMKIARVGIVVPLVLFLLLQALLFLTRPSQGGNDESMSKAE